MSSHCSEKIDRLQHLLRNMGRVLVAYSGGVDSTFLLHSAAEALGSANTTAVIARSPLRSFADYTEAVALARSRGIPCHTADTDELADPAIAANSADRCYHCKKNLFLRCADLAHSEAIPWIIEGSNADDALQYRPGRKALQELGIRSPLAEAKLTKEDIRQLSRDQGLPTWSKPADACLATRIPYGEPLSRQVLSIIEQGEAFLRDQGFRPVRIRYYRGLARIEIRAAEIERLLEPGLAARVAQTLKDLGLQYVTLDLEGYRSGSMDEVLPDAILRTG